MTLKEYVLMVLGSEAEVHRKVIGRLMNDVPDDKSDIDAIHRFECNRLYAIASARLNDRLWHELSAVTDSAEVVKVLGRFRDMVTERAFDLISQSGRTGIDAPKTARLQAFAHYRYILTKALIRQDLER